MSSEVDGHQSEMNEIDQEKYGKKRSDVTIEQLRNETNIGHEIPGHNSNSEIHDVDYPQNRNIHQCTSEEDHSEVIIEKDVVECPLQVEGHIQNNLEIRKTKQMRHCVNDELHLQREDFERN